MAFSRKWTALALTFVLAGGLAGCGTSGASPTAAPATVTAAPETAAPTTAAPATATPGLTVDESEHMSIAFFGYAKSNGFANGTFKWIEEYAAEHNADATFFDGAFDNSGATQIKQIQDATTSGKYKVFIIQANEDTSMVPAIKQAIAQGIAVVAEFAPIGGRYDTREPQVPGMFFVGDVPSDNGKTLGELGLMACKEFPAPCKVAYLLGFSALPFDAMRTKSAVETLRAGGATVWDQYEAGYNAETGRKVGQDLFQAHPDVNVIVAASGQAIMGVEQVVPPELKGKVKLIGNDGSVEGVQAVNEGRWFAAYYIPERLAARKAAELGLAKARGATNLPTSVTLPELGNVLGTSENLKGITGDYHDD